MLRFAILKTVGEEEQIVLEYNENQILSRLQARMREKMSERETYLKHSFNKAEVNGFLGEAFPELIAEFKEKTVTLK